MQWQQVFPIGKPGLHTQPRNGFWEAGLAALMEDKREREYPKCQAAAGV